MWTQLDMVEYASNPSTEEAEVEDCDCEASLGYTT